MTNLTMAQRVKITDKAHRSFGRVGEVAGLVDGTKLVMVSFPVYSEVSGAWTYSGSLALNRRQFRAVA